MTAERTSPWVWVALGVLATLGLLAFLSFVAGARLDPATAGLVVAAAALVYCLRALFRVVRVLSQPDLQRDLGTEGVGIVVVEHERELREERKRLLRAIHELEFDFQLGKLSEGDYRSVRQGYELRAIEVMRTLETELHLHPDLVAELRADGLLGDAELERMETGATPPRPASQVPTEIVVREQPTHAAVDVQPETQASAEVEPVTGTRADDVEDAEAPARAVASPRACASCSGVNDLDARFCKHCGRELAA